MGDEKDMLKVGTRLASFYALRAESELYLIDAGFIGGISQLQKSLKRAGWESLPVRGIFLTHGHLDHILNVSKLAKMTGAWIAAPSLDAGFYAGKPQYSGMSFLTCGVEAMGRLALGFRSFEANRNLNDGDELDIWGGLRVVTLPGHTAGHSGFYSPSRKLLFCGDLFASFRRFSHFPPRFLNLDSKQARSSVRKALELDLRGVLPHHCDQASPAEHLARLKKLAR